MSFLLFLVASLLKWVLSPALYLFGTIISIFRGPKEFDRYQHNLAIAKDQYGNAVGKEVFNLLLRKKDGYRFGNPDETISSVIGKNKVTGTLTWLGRALDYILDSLEPEHSTKSIDTTETEETA